MGSPFNKKRMIENTQYSRIENILLEVQVVQVDCFQHNVFHKSIMFNQSTA